MRISSPSLDRRSTFSPGWLRGACACAASAWLAMSAARLPTAAAESPEQSDVDIATFQGGKITLADVEAVIAQQIPVERVRIARSAGVPEVVERLIRYDLLALEAKARGYADNPEVQTAAKQKAAELLTAELAPLDPASVSPDELGRARQEFGAEFTRPALQRAAHIVVATREEALALLSELKNKSRAEFGRIAGERSLDPNTRKQGGELGYFPRSAAEQGSQIAPEIVEAAFKLTKVGEFAPAPIATAGGFSVLMLTGSKPVFKTSDAEIEEQLRERLATAQHKQKFDALMQRLRAEYAPKVHAELLDRIVLPQTNDSRTARNPEGFPVFPPDPREPPKLIEPDGS